MKWERSKLACMALSKQEGELMGWVSIKMTRCLGLIQTCTPLVQCSADMSLSKLWTLKNVFVSSSVSLDVSISAWAIDVIIVDFPVPCRPKMPTTVNSLLSVKKSLKFSTKFCSSIIFIGLVDIKFGNNWSCCICDEIIDIWTGASVFGLTLRLALESFLLRSCLAALDLDTPSVWEWSGLRTSGWGFRAISI